MGESTEKTVSKFQVNGQIYSIDVDAVATVEACEEAAERANLAAAHVP